MSVTAEHTLTALTDILPAADKPWAGCWSDSGSSGRDVEPKPQNHLGSGSRDGASTHSCRAKGLTAARGLLQNQTAREHHPQIALQPAPAV